MSILITGGTGYLGRALAKTLLGRNYTRICIYSRGEHAQAQMRQRIGNDDRMRYFVGDVRDLDRLERAMHKVDAVIHAAALKRIEVGHYNPDEMVKTNVLGTMNVLEAARRAGVRRVVLVSSDKAYQPISAYGHSKAMAESLVLASNQMTPDTEGVVVRYGNVAGSTGSVIPVWRGIREADEYATLRLTNPDCTRFWMTRTQAVDLVLSALWTTTIDRAIVPDLPAYRLHDLAVAMGATKTEVIGLPAWEKMHESMGPGNSSDAARRMTIGELTEAVQRVYEEDE